MKNTTFVKIINKEVLKEKIRLFVIPVLFIPLTVILWTVGVFPGILALIGLVVYVGAVLSDTNSYRALTHIRKMFYYKPSKALELIRVELDLLDSTGDSNDNTIFSEQNKAVDRSVVSRAPSNVRYGGVSLGQIGKVMSSTRQRYKKLVEKYKMMEKLLLSEMAITPEPATDNLYFE